MTKYLDKAGLAVVLKNIKSTFIDRNTIADAYDLTSATDGKGKNNTFSDVTSSYLLTTDSAYTAYASLTNTIIDNEKVIAAETAKLEGWFNNSYINSSLDSDSDGIVDLISGNGTVRVSNVITSSYITSSYATADEKHIITAGGVYNAYQGLFAYISSKGDASDTAVQAIRDNLNSYVNDNTFEDNKTYTFKTNNNATWATNVVTLDTHAGTSYGVVILDTDISETSGNAITNSAISTTTLKIAGITKSISYLHTTGIDKDDLISQLGLTSAMHFRGVVTGDTLPDVNGYSAGDVILYGDKEYVLNSSNEWVELGDESSFALKTTKLTIASEGGLVRVNGDDLQTDAVLYHAYTSGWTEGKFEDASGKVIKTLSYDKFGHVTAATFADAVDSYTDITATDTNSGTDHVVIATAINHGSANSSTTISLAYATETVSGAMSAADKTKLNDINTIAIDELADAWNTYLSQYTFDTTASA